MLYNLSLFMRDIRRHLQALLTPHILTAVAAGVLLILWGYALGRILTVRTFLRPLEIVEDTRPQIPVLHFDGIEDGMLRGRIDGDARIFINDDYVVPEEDGSFAVRADAFFINYVRVQVPEGARFVASKRGKKYYSVDSAAGSNLAPENRVYFSTEEEAKAAGYSGN